MNIDNEKITKLDMEELNEVAGGRSVRLYCETGSDESKLNAGKTTSSNNQNGKSNRPPILKA